MQYIEINGNRPLAGEITAQGAKNSVLPILAACVLLDGVAQLHRCPHISDVTASCDILKYLGGSVTAHQDILTVDTQSVYRCDIPPTLMQEMRSSIIFLGSLAAKHGEAKLCLPGGCNIGERPIDMHLQALSDLGYSVQVQQGSILCRRGSAKGGQTALPFPSVGATENAVLAAVLLEGESVIHNAAAEPEVADLAAFLNAAGAQIHGAGTSRIEIDGVPKLGTVNHTVMPDRMQVATVMAAVAAAGGSVTIKGADMTHLNAVRTVLEKAGCKIASDNNSIKIKATHQLHAVPCITTGVYPHFPTDAQAPVMAALCLAHGTSQICETVFENRMRHVPQLRRFGADISVSKSTATVKGQKGLYAADAMCTDLRGGAALIVAALAAVGISHITHVHHLDRGYENIEEQFSQLGAEIRRVYDEKG